MKKHSFTLILLLAALTALVSFYLAGHPFQGYLFNSDALYLPALFLDIFSNNGKISDWYLTPAPGFFPDFPIFFLAYLFGAKAYSQIIIFSIIQAILAFGSIWLLANQTSRANRVTSSTVATIFLIWLSVNAGEPFAFLLASAYHYGIFISAIIFSSLWLQYQRIESPSEGKWLLAAMSLLAFLSSLSDNLFLVQALAPFIAACFFFNLMNRDFSIPKYLLPVIPVAFGALGSFSYKFIVENRTRYPVHIGLEKFKTNLADVFSVLQGVILKAPGYGLILVAYAGAGFFLAYYLARRKSFVGLPRELVWLVLFSFFSLLATVFAVSLVTNLPVAPRYLIAVLSWPVVLVSLVVAHYLNGRFYYPGILSSAIIVSMLGLDAYRLSERNGINFEFYPGQVSCIDDAIEKEGLQNGIAQYWDAKYIQEFSRLKVNIAQHFDNLEEMRWITTKRYFREGYDFAVISENAPPPYKISSAALSQINGAPSRIVSCGDKSVYIYGKDKLRVRKEVKS